MNRNEILRKRLQEIREEAKSTKSDAVLTGLKAERQEILKEIGKKCDGCGRYFLPEALKYGVCVSCNTQGNYGD